MGDLEARPLVLKACGSLKEVDPAGWDACAGGDNPFLRHAFLQALEESGSATPEAGWAPHHLLLESGDGELVGAMPLYLKGHSQGEYVFDHAWAHAYERAGGRYYPKLQSAVPFTPVTGPRLLMRPGEEVETTRKYLLQGALEVARQLDVSSLHITFATEEESRFLTSCGLLQRTGEQFHWLNPGYGGFDDFLGDLASRKRKAVRKERRQALESGVEIELLTGSDLREAHWDHFFDFYMDTGSRKWGTPYLTRAFFSLLGERMADQVLLVMCRRAGRYIAGALNLIGADALYGRYWGCVEDHPALHFEACYYQAIEFAISRGLARVEAGAQGQHKLARGYLPMKTWSAHWLRDAGFHEAVARFLTEERREVEAEIDYLSDHSPFRMT